MPASSSSTALAGARYSPPVYSGAGRARVSSLPLTVSGTASIATIADGTRWAGSRSARAVRSVVGSAVPVT
ncbi:hypothetical protein MYIN104542_29525 [Mycobacterium intermedium]